MKNFKIFKCYFTQEGSYIFCLQLLEENSYIFNILFLLKSRIKAGHIKKLIESS